MIMTNNTYFALIINCCFIIYSFKAIEFTSAQKYTSTVSTNEDSNTNAIEGFGTELQCMVNGCRGPRQQVSWYKGDQLITTDQLSHRNRISIKHNVILDPLKDCFGQCSNTRSCTAHHYCLDNSCCPCKSEEYTLAITNLTALDSGTYNCKLEPDGNSAEIRLTVLEGGTFPTFSQNLSFDHTQCCETQKMSPQCLPMCRPSILETVKFDPVPCQKEFHKLLHCATEGGNISHTHCCRLNFVPPFCWQYCSGSLKEYQRSNRLCVYWMPEILYCYDRAYAPFPGPPEQLVVTNITSTSVEACWESPKIRGDSVEFYTLRYQEIPRFPFLGGSIPFLIADSDSPQDDDITEKTVDEELPADDGFSRVSPIRFRRKKRQASLIISTHNFATNQTEVREFKYLEINTTGTCAIIAKLKPATQYSLYVIATNFHGASLPSLKQSVLTSPAIYPNTTLPNIRECCVRNKVEPNCVSKLCDVENPPSSAGAFNLAFVCRKEFPQVTPCLADGRDHTQCCKDKGVGGECLKLCNGAGTQLGMASVLCLSLDVQSIYMCYREGYASLPSPPVNVTAVDVTSNSVRITWGDPAVNLHKVTGYSLFYKMNSARQFIEMKNVTSPVSLYHLAPDTLYDVYVVANGAQGSSLKSSIVIFSTAEPEYSNICRYGRILRDSFDQPFICGPTNQCPALFKCTDSATDDDERMYCCPTEAFVNEKESYSPPDVSSCCRSKGVTGECLKLCAYNVTLDELMKTGPSCLEHLKTYVECGGAGRNNRPCCEKAGVLANDICMEFCEPPLTKEGKDYESCVHVGDKIFKCGYEGVLTLPGQVQNLHVADSGSIWATLAWDRPERPSIVKTYEVRFYDADKQKLLKQNTSGLSLTVPDLKPDVNYVANVVTWNNKGSSLPSANVSVLLIQHEMSVTDDYKPRPPTDVSRSWYKNRSANITWSWVNRSVTGKIIEQYRFKVQYKIQIADRSSLNKSWQTVNTTENYIILTNLTPSMPYDVRVIAINMYRSVESLPSELFNFLTQEVVQPPSIELRTEPEYGITEGDTFTVFCKGQGDPAPRLSLKKGGVYLANGTDIISYVFKNIRRQDLNDSIICTADNGGHAIRQKFNLNIKYGPIVEAQNNLMSAIQDLSATMFCRVQAYPKPSVTWLFINTDNSNNIESSSSNTFINKNKRPPPIDRVREASNKIISFDLTEKENVYNVSLSIKKVQLIEAGTYYCHSCNEIGCANATIKLSVEPFPVPKGPDYVLRCCEQQKVVAECLSACTPEININAYDHRMCIDEVPKLLKCAKDGIDNRRCCSSYGVPPPCISYCNGGLMIDDNPLNLDCANFRSQIVTCVQETHKLVSSPPVDLQVAVLSSDKFNVTWKPPTFNNNSIQLYVLYYRKTGDLNYTEMRTESTYAVVNGLDPYKLYNFTVIAVNNYGFSTFSKVASAGLAGSEASPGDFSSYSSGAAGTALAVLFCLLLSAVIVLAVVYFTRNPYKLPAFVLKMRTAAKLNGRQTRSDTVAFENPGYDREGKITGLPGQDNNVVHSESLTGNGEAGGWESARLETPENSPMPEQRGMRYTQLT